MPRRTLDEILPAGQSPYFGMFTAGVNGYELGEVEGHCRMLGIPLRAKDVQAWADGNFKHRVWQQRRRSVLNPILDTGMRTALLRRKVEDMPFESMPKLPDGWRGSERRFFPCTGDNKPMQKWGWRDDFIPNLMLRTDAEVLSPVRWVGQNMLYQKFVVLDIDGVGHGTRDEQVIEFGSQFKDRTLTLEDPRKPGSFHLYFECDRLLPVQHFGWAKLDFMGNAVNAAVYFKNKKGNGLPMMKMDKAVWDAVMQYQKSRKGN